MARNAQETETGSVRGRNAASRKTAKVQTARLQMVLSVETAQRLGVHCTIAGVNQSKEADRILLQWLRAYGKTVFSFSPETSPPAQTVSDSEAS